MSFCKSDQKNMPMVGFLTCNDSDILRAKTGPYGHIGYQTNIPPTTVLPGLVLFDFQNMYISRRGDTVGPPVWKSNIAPCLLCLRSLSTSSVRLWQSEHQQHML